MSLLCIGATKHLPNNKKEDVLGEFLKNREIYLTYDPKTGLKLNQYLAQLKSGQNVAVKSFSVKHGLYLKAYGTIIDEPTDAAVPVRKVKWLWTGNHHFGRLDDKLDNMRSGALYHEINLDVIQTLMGLI